MTPNKSRGCLKTPGREKTSLTFGRHAMFKSGWLRLWIVLTCLVLGGTVVVSCFYVWGRAMSYTFVSVTIADTAKPEDRQLAESLKQEATAKTFTGQFQYSQLLTLESLARRGAVTQVGVQWLEPGGWSFRDRDYLDVFDKREITASEMIGRVSGHVHTARLRRTAWLFAFALGACVATVALGTGVAWIRRGFTKR
jgi:hypothetical protein